MFIDVTRYGGMRLLRVAIAAIAYIDQVEGGSALHLIGGETIRVNETPADIEERTASVRMVRAIQVDNRRIEYDPPLQQPDAASVCTAAPAQSQHNASKRGSNRGRR
ncbi:hypothetical protein [Novosphingobium sp. 9]|uniref:hypothetical protein n=1 Tax=Novosphingobium sp. 9 TaxID=2025349 RepID=UPI0021B5E49E|nr:hypothetical protein [Novosphingobium sp. 9]